MSKLNIGVEIRDFDLERMGFSLSVLDDSKKRQASEAYLRMTLPELNAFLNALKAADGEFLQQSDLSKIYLRNRDRQLVRLDSVASGATAIHAPEPSTFSLSPSTSVRNRSMSRSPISRATSYVGWSE